MSGIAITYTVFPDEESARNAARSAVADGLAACANILAPCTAIFEWNGEISENAEIPVIFKTTAAQADALIERIEAMHPYEVPAILSWPIVRVPHAFAKWVNDQTDR